MSFFKKYNERNILFCNGKLFLILRVQDLVPYKLFRSLLLSLRFCGGTYPDLFPVYRG